MQYNALPRESEEAPEEIRVTPLNSVLGVSLGKDTSGNFAHSLYGLGIRTTDGRYVAKRRGCDELLDVTKLLISSVDPAVYRIPVTELQRDDLVLVSEDPFSVRYIIGWERGGRAVALNPEDGDITDFLPVQHPFLHCFVRVVSFLEDFPNSDIPEIDIFDEERESGEIDESRTKRSQRRGPRERVSMRRDFCEDLDTEQILLLSMALGQQQDPNASSNLVNTLLLSQALCGGKRGMDKSLILAMLLGGGGLMGAATATGTAQPMPNNSLALLLALGLCREPEGREDRERRLRFVRAAGSRPEMRREEGEDGERKDEDEDRP